MDAMREAFEKWADDFNPQRRLGGEYSDTLMDLAWDVWQAALSQPEAQPVAWRHAKYPDITTTDPTLAAEWDASSNNYGPCTPLYTASAVKVQDLLHMRDIHHEKVTNPDEAWLYATAWNDCRAAMLKETK